MNIVLLIMFTRHAIKKNDSQAFAPLSGAGRRGPLNLPDLRLVCAMKLSRTAFWSFTLSLGTLRPMYRAALIPLIALSTSAPANEYRDNPSRVVSLAKYPQFSVVGELDRDEVLSDGRAQQSRGSAVIVSPCYALTNYHVVFGKDDKPLPGKDYTMAFRAGEGQDQGTFAGRTTASPVLWGNGADEDWALLRLKNCVGTLQQFGWIESSSRLWDGLVSNHTQIAAVGYSYRTSRAALSLSVGRVVGKNPWYDMLNVTSSFAIGQSGGAAFVIEQGQLRLAGLLTRSDWLPADEISGHRPDDFEKWDACRSNYVLPAAYPLNRSDVKSLLDVDKSNWKQGNPAAERQTKTLEIWSAETTNERRQWQEIFDWRKRFILPDCVPRKKSKRAL